jgi:Spy/CpxP family protein refolding chaperone
MKAHKYFLACLCWLIAAGTPVQAQAQQGFRELPPGKWWKQPLVIRELGLTGDQQARIEALWIQNRRVLIDLKTELDRRHIDLSALLAQPQADEDAVLKAYDRMAAARAEIDRAGFLMRLRIKSILLPEQQRRFEELSASLRRGRAGNRLGDGAPAQRTPRGNIPEARQSRPRIR